MKRAFSVYFYTFNQCLRQRTSNVFFYKQELYLQSNIFKRLNVAMFTSLIRIQTTLLLLQKHFCAYNFEGDCFFDYWTILRVKNVIHTPWEFLALVLANELSLEIEWQPVSSIYQLSSQYSGRSQQCWRVSFTPLIYESSSLFINPLMTVPKAPIMIGIIVIFMLHNLFVFSVPYQGRDTYSIFTLFQFSVVRRDSKVYSFANYLLFW